MAHLWDDLLTEQDRAVIKKAGYDTRGSVIADSRGKGKAPALLVIDMQRLIVAENVPILEAVALRPIAIGEIAYRAMQYIVPFIEVCRSAGVPVVYTRVVPENCDPALIEVVQELAPQPGDVVIDKRYSSAFYGTPLLTYLVRMGIDTVIVVGNATSGCVRATVVDARQMGFNVIVPQECVFDRVEASHKISLLDMWMKYASVIPAEEAASYVRQIGQKA